MRPYHLKPLLAPQGARTRSRAMLLLVLIHQAIRLPDGLPKGMHTADAAEADGQVQLRILRKRNMLDRILNFGLISLQNLLVHLREQEQKFIVVIPNQDIRIADAGMNRRSDPLQRGIARLMAEGVVHLLEVVYIRVTQTDNALLIAAVCLTVLSGTVLGTGVDEQIHVFPSTAVEQKPAAVGVDPAPVLQF